MVLHPWLGQLVALLDLRKDAALGSGRWDSLYFDKRSFALSHYLVRFWLDFLVSRRQSARESWRQAVLIRLLRVYFDLISDPLALGH